MVGPVTLAEIAGDAQPRGGLRAALDQVAKRLDQQVQSLLGADACEIADGERLIGWGGAGGAVPLELEPQGNAVDAFARHRQ